MLWKSLKLASVVVALAAAPTLTAQAAPTAPIAPASLGGTGTLVAAAAQIVDAKAGDGVLEQVHRRGHRHWHGPRWRPHRHWHGPRWRGPRHRWYGPGPRYRGWRDRGPRWDGDRGGRRRGD